MDKLPQDPFFQTKVLQRAILSGAVHGTQFLLRQGCNPNVVCGPQALRPLILACYIDDEKKRLEIVELLIKFGANPGLVDRSGRHAVYYACWLGLKDVLSRLLQTDDSDLTIGDYVQGNTCLHICVMTGQFELLKILIDKMKKNGLSLSTKNKLGLTPLSLAHLHKQTACFHLLHKEGALPRYHIKDLEEILSRRMEADQVLHDNLLMFAKFNRTSLPPISKKPCALVHNISQNYPRSTPQLPQACLHIVQPLPELSSHPSSQVIIKSFLEKVIHIQNSPLYPSSIKDQQEPITMEWIDAVRECKPPPETSFASIVSTAMHLQNFRARLSSANVFRQQSTPVTSWLSRHMTTPGLSSSRSPSECNNE